MRDVVWRVADYQLIGKPDELVSLRTGAAAKTVVIRGVRCWPWE